MNQIDQSDQRAQAGEVHMPELLHKMWAVRIPVLIAALFVTLGYWGIWVARQVTSPHTVAYSRIIRFNFDGVEQGLYPNGSPFYIADIIAPSILAKVYDINGLSDLGISEAAFAQSFNIQLHSPESQFIIEKYHLLLERRGIRSTEIVRLQEQMKEDLQQAISRSALITFHGTSGTNMSKEKIDKILLDLPRVWADNAINRYGVLEIDAAIYSKLLFDGEQYESLDYAVSLDLIEENIRLVHASIDSLLLLPNSMRVKDDVSGYSLVDLRKLVGDVMSYDLYSLVIPVRKLGLSKNREGTQSHYEHRLVELKQKRTNLSSRVDMVTQTLDHYIRVSGEIMSKEKETLQGIVTIDRSFLDKVTDLIEEGGDMEYRQNLIDLILRYREELVEVDLEIVQKEAVLAAIRENENENENGHEQLLIDQFPHVLAKMRAYMDILGRLHILLGKENFGYAGALYGIGDIGGTRVSRSVLSNWDIYIYALLVSAISFAALLIAMTARWMKDAPKVNEDPSPERG